MVLPIYDDNPFKLPVKPVITWLLILANILVFMVEISGDDGGQLIAQAFGVTPTALLGGTGVGSLPPALTLISYQFVHGDIGHIFGNMIFLWVFGDDVEEALGRVRFLVFYLLCGVVGGLVFVASDPTFSEPLIGASGSIAGVLIGYLMMRPCAKVTVLLTIIPLRISAYWVIGIFILTQLANLESTSSSGVAYWCHLGGMLAGAALFPLMRLPGVKLFECIAEPHYPVAADAGSALTRRPERS